MVLLLYSDYIDEVASSIIPLIRFFLIRSDSGKVITSATLRSLRLRRTEKRRLTSHLRAMRHVHFFSIQKLLQNQLSIVIRDSFAFLFVSFL